MHYYAVVPNDKPLDADEMFIAVSNEEALSYWRIFCSLNVTARIHYISESRTLDVTPTHHEDWSR